MEKTRAKGKVMFPLCMFVIVSACACSLPPYCFCNYHPETRGVFPEVRVLETLGWLDRVWHLAAHRQGLETPLS